MSLEEVSWPVSQGSRMEAWQAAPPLSKEQPMALPGHWTALWGLEITEARLATGKPQWLVEFYFASLYSVKSSPHRPAFLA